MFILQLNDMRSSKIEILTPIARADTIEELEIFMEKEKVEGYRDGNWGKSFKKGGPLEWYNPPWTRDESIINVGSEDEWAKDARRAFSERVMSVPHVSNKQ